MNKELPEHIDRSFRNCLKRVREKDKALSTKTSNTTASEEVLHF